MAAKTHDRQRMLDSLLESTIDYASWIEQSALRYLGIDASKAAHKACITKLDALTHNLSCYENDLTDAIIQNVIRKTSGIRDAEDIIQEYYNLMLHRAASPEEIKHQLPCASHLASIIASSQEFRKNIEIHKQSDYRPKLPRIGGLSELHRNGFGAILSCLSNVDWLPTHIRDYAFLFEELSRYGTEKKPSIYIDVTIITQSDSKTGIQRVTREIIKRFIINEPAGFKVIPVVARDGLLFEDYSLVSRLFELPHPSEARACISPNKDDVLLGLDLNPEIYQCFEFIASNFIPSNVYYLLYDIIPILHSDFWPDERGAFTNHAKWLHFAAATGSFISISNSALHDATSWLDKNLVERPNSHKDSVIYLGFDFENRKDVLWDSRGDEIRFKDHIDTITSSFQYIALAVGTLEPRKGYDLLIEEVCNHNAANPSAKTLLIIAGKDGWKNQILKERIEHDCGDNVIWLKGVNDTQLDWLYSKCDFVASFSRAEGFGLSLVEGMHHKKPLLVTPINSYLEIANFTGYSSFIFANNPGTGESIVKALSLSGRRATTSLNMTWDCTYSSIISTISKTSTTNQQ